MAFILALFVRTFVFENFKIPSGSMEENLLIGDQPGGQQVSSLQETPTAFFIVSFPIGRRRRGDVVVFQVSRGHPPGFHQAVRRGSRRHRRAAPKTAVHQWRAAG